MNSEKGLKKGLFRTWVISYLGISFIPVLFFILFALISSSYLFRSAESENKASLLIFKTLIDNALDQNNSLSEDILLSSEFSPLLTGQDNKLTSQDLFGISTNLRHMLNAYPSISDAFIYSKEIDKYISPMRWGNLRDLEIRNEADLPFTEEERKLLFSNEIDRLTIMDATYTSYSGKRTPRLLILRPLSYVSSLVSSKVYLASIIDMESILYSPLSSYKDFLIMDERNGEILFSYNSESFTLKEKESLNTLEKGVSKVIGGDIATSEGAMWTGYKYIFLVEKGVYYHSFYVLVFIALLLFLLSLFIGFLFIYLKVKKDWRTFEIAINKTGAEIDWSRKVASEYTPFISNFEKKQKEQEVMGNLIKKQTEELKQHILSKLVDNPNLVSAESLKEAGINFISDYFVVVIAKGASSLVLDDMMGDFIFFPFPSSFSFSALVNVKEQLKGEEFYSLFAKMMKSEIDRNDQIESIASSNLSKGIKSLGEDYLEALNTLEVLNSSKSREFMFSRDAEGAENKKTFFYSSEEEYKLGKAILNGDEEISKEIIESVIERNKEKGVKARSLRYLLFSLAGTVVNEANKIRAQYDVEIPEITFSSIMQSENFSDSVNEVLNGIKKVTEAVKKERDNFQGELGSYQIYRKVLKEIKENYQKQEMNVSYLSEKMGLSVSTISKIFKKYHNLNISEYLASYRIMMAKKYLALGFTNEEVVKLSGFGSERTLFRLFQKEEGITPKKYREMKESLRNEET